MSRWRKLGHVFAPDGSKPWMRSHAANPVAVAVARRLLHLPYFKARMSCRPVETTIDYDSEHAAIRARVFYYHQIGYYAIGVQQSIPERRKNAQLYLDILCGEEAIAAARASARKARKPRAV